MGSEQSSESASKKQKDEQYQRMLKNALEQQRKTYEEKCKKLLQAQQNIEVKNQSDERTLKQQLMIDTLVKQKEMYEKIYNKLIEEQRMTASCFEASLSTTNKGVLQQNPSSSVETRGDHAPLYPSLPQAPAVDMQPSTSSAIYHGHSSYTSTQNNNNNKQSIFCQPSAPTAPVGPVAPETTSTASQNQKVKKRNNKADKINTYQCPTCKSHINALTNTLFQCENGHSSCILCKENVSRCGICKSTITNMRNIELENLTENLIKNNVQVVEKVECPNKSDGCSLSFKSEHLEGHLKECLFREMECPLASAKYTQCYWRGKINQMQAHFLECHSQHTGAVNSELCFDLAANSYSIFLTAMGNFNFLVHVKLDENLQTLFMTVQLIGSRVSASKWTYEIHVYNKGEPRRKFTYIDACLPNVIPFSDVANTAQCAALPLQYAKTFLKDNKFTYKFYIKRDETTVRHNWRRNNKECK